MSDTRLEKVTERLYKEGSVEWGKRLEPLSVTLRNVRVSRAVSIGRSETSISRLWKDTADADTQRRVEHGGEEATTAAADEAEDEYYENFYWRVTGTGYIDRRRGTIKRLGLIKADGTRTGPGEEVGRVDVSLLSLPTNASDTDKREASGSLSHTDEGFENRAEHSLTLTLLVPASLLEPFCRELISGRLHELSVGAYIDVFQTEMARYVVAEPGMQAPFYIEEEHSSTAYLSSLDAHRDVAKTTATATDDLEGLGLETGSDAPADFAEKYIRQKSGTQKFIESLGPTLVTAGAIIAIWQFYEEPGQLPVPLLLAGIAVLLFLLATYTEGILVGLEYLQRIVDERRKKKTDR